MRFTHRSPATEAAPDRRPAFGLAAWLASKRPGWAEGTRAWTVFAGLLAGIILLPIGTIVVLALGSEQNVWPHLLATVLPRALADTFILMAGVGASALALGTAAAWLVTMYRFPGRGVLDRLLAMPTYIVAYCYVELLDYSGPVQQLLRAVFGWQSARDYWFPEIRTLGGCVLVLSSVLYPYVYLSARASFAQQSVCVLEVARTLGQTPFGAFQSVALPLARPALAAGVALTLMECLNDLGAAQYLGVQTLTVSIYTTWLQRSNLAGAAQIALVALLLVLALLLSERIARGGARVHHTTGRYRAIPFSDLQGWRAYIVTAACVSPGSVGFMLTLAVTLAQASTYLSEALMLGFWRAVRNSVTVAGVAAASTVCAGLALVYARRLTANAFVRAVVPIAGLGYALPGTVLALGLLMPLAAFDNAVDALLRSQIGISSGLLLSGSLFIIVLAYTVRFLAIALGSLEAGFEKLSPNLDAVARTL